MKHQKMYDELTNSIKQAYQESLTMEEAEKLAAKFLHAQLLISEELKNADLDARMKKAGLKTIKAGVYLEAATQGDKKPSDVLLNNIVDSNEEVNKAQTQFDEAEVLKNELQSFYDVFREAHVFFRQTSKGSNG